MIFQTLTMRKQRVDRLVEEEYWNGFFARLGDKLGPDKPLTYTQAPFWYNEVAGVAYKAGFLYCEAVLAELDRDRTFPRSVDRNIPGAVFAEAYGAARLAS